MKELSNLLYSEEGRVGVITLNRPNRLNALSIGLLRELDEVLSEIRQREGIGALVITGSPRADGRPCFCAGADLKEIEEGGGRPRSVSLGGKPGEALLQILDEFGQAVEPADRAFCAEVVFERMESFPKPIIAAIDGVCTAGGLELALACDIRVASETAVISDLHMKNLGTLGGAGVQTRLPIVVGIAKAKEIMWSGEPMNGNEACRIGLVNRVVPPDKMIEETKNLAAKLADMNPLGMRVSKMVLNASLSQSVHESLRFSEVGTFLVEHLKKTSD